MKENETIKRIEHFMLPEHTNSLYQNEARSSIALTKDVADKINELVDAINEAYNVNLEKTQEQDGKIRGAVLYMKDNLLNSLNDLMELLRDSGFIDDRIAYHCGDLKQRMDNLLGSVTKGSTTLDAEIIDARTGADDKRYPNLGEAMRTQLRNTLRSRGFKTGDTLSNLDECEANTIYSLTDTSGVENIPENIVGTVITLSSDDAGSRGVQFYAMGTGEMFYRVFWTSASGVKTWNNWNTHNLTEKTFPKILLPDTIYAVVGQELPLYFCQMFDCLDWKSELTPSITHSNGGEFDIWCYDDRISINCDRGGTYKFSITMNKIVDGVKVSSPAHHITIKACENYTPATSSKVLFIGDSRTDFARLCKYPKSVLKDKVYFVGTRLETNGGYRHEGRSGWCAEHYCKMATYKSELNPFWDGSKFNFTHYMNTNGYTGIEYVNILFGVNSLYSDDAPKYIDEIIKSIHTYDSNIKVTVMTEYTLPFSAYYSSDYSRSLLSRCFYNKIVDKFKDRENENVFVLPTNAVVDDYFDWVKKSVNVSQYNDETVEVIEDNIHPKQSGYNKIGSIWTAFYLNDKKV